MNGTSVKSTKAFRVGFALAAAMAAAQPVLAVSDSKAVTALLERGRQAFDAGDITGARDAFASALQLNSSSIAAARALGIAYLHLDKPASAVKPLELASSSKVLDRSLVLAIASERLSVHSSGRSPMQVVKFLKAYLEAHAGATKQVDEPMLNALGLALSKSESSGISATNTLFADAGSYYKKLSDRLEATRVGEKRWGPDWLPAAEVDGKQRALSGSQATINANTLTLKKLAASITAAEAEKAAIPYAEGENTLTEKRNAVQARIDQMTTQQKAAQTAVEAAQKTVTDARPHWPDQIPVVDITLDTKPFAPAGGAGPVSAHEKPAGDASPRPKGADANFPDPKTPVTPTPADDSAVDAPPKPQAADTPRSAVGFAVAPDLVVTVTAVVSDATDIELETDKGIKMKAEVVRSDRESGLTLLRVPDGHLLALSLAADVRAGLAKCEGMPDASMFNPVVADIAATLSNASNRWSAALEKSPRLPGAPLMQNGKVVGVETGDCDSDIAAVPMVTVAALKQLLQSDGNAKQEVKDAKVAVFQVIATR